MTRTHDLTTWIPYRLGSIHLQAKRCGGIRGEGAIIAVGVPMRLPRRKRETTARRSTSCWLDWAARLVMVFAAFGVWTVIASIVDALTR